MHGSPAIEGVPNVTTTLAVRLLGSRVKYPVHWLDATKPSKGCYGPRCRFCPDVPSYWCAFAAQREVRRLVQSDAPPRQYPEGFERWTTAEVAAWMRANPSAPVEEIEQIDVITVAFCLHEAEAAELPAGELRGVEVVCTRKHRGAAVKVAVRGRSSIGLVADFDPTKALVKRYGPSIVDGIKMLTSNEAIEQQDTGEEPRILKFG